MRVSPRLCLPRTSLLLRNAVSIIIPLSVCSTLDREPVEPYWQIGRGLLCGTVRSVNSSRLSSSFACAVGVASLVLTLTACGSAVGAGACPTAAPDSAAAPEWTLPGATGSVAVTGSTDTAAPLVKVETPFTVTQTQVQTLKAGDGPVVPGTATVSVCYMGVNGRDGSVFDSSYQRGAPVEFALTRVVPGFQKAITGQKVGSTVAVAVTSADGYPNGQPRAGIQPGDSLVFAIKILGSS